jgi:hypothetical protein
VGVRFSAPVQTSPGAHPASCTTGTGSFPGVECGRGVTLTPHPILVPRSKKQSTAIPPLSLRAFMAYKTGETYLPNLATGFSYLQKDYCTHLKPATSYNAHSAAPKGKYKCFQHCGHYSKSSCLFLSHPAFI